MSISYNLYIGPYIQVHNPPKPSFEELYACPNSKCSKYQSGTDNKFCFQCGTPVSLLKVPSKEKIYFDCYEECNERLRNVFSEYSPDGMKDYSFFIPNSSKVGNHLDACDVTVVEKYAEAIMEEVKQLETKFSKDIKKIQKVFGNEAVTIRWGILTDVS